MSDEHATPGQFPPVHDEAPDTPMWLPMVGVALAVIAVLAVLYRVGNPVPDPDAAAPTEEAAPAEPAETP